MRDVDDCRHSTLDLGFVARQPAEHPPGENFLVGAVQRPGGDRRVDVRARFAPRLRGLDDASERVEELADLGDPAPDRRR